LDIFADFGFLTVGGVEPEKLSQTVLPLTQGNAPLAFTLRVGPLADINAVVQAVKELQKSLPSLKILAVDAPEDVLVQRYLKSEKKHAFETSVATGLQTAIAAEKKFYGPLKDLKDYSIDTSTTTALELRHKITRVLGFPIENEDFTVYVNTFGFKYGIPLDAELVFDMRFMTNPFYDESLRPLTGRDKPVRDFIFNLDHARNFFEKWADLIADMLPLYQAQGKTRLTIAVGCTGGKHRSVCMGEELAEYLKKQYPAFNIVITHREMLRWEKPVEPQASLPQNPTCSVGEVS
jgi:RNase adapter protein RapZ